MLKFPLGHRVLSPRMPHAPAAVATRGLTPNLFARRFGKELHGWTSEVNQSTRWSRWMSEEGNRTWSGNIFFCENG